VPGMPLLRVQVARSGPASPLDSSSFSVAVRMQIILAIRGWLLVQELNPSITTTSAPTDVRPNSSNCCRLLAGLERRSVVDASLWRRTAEAPDSASFCESVPGLSKVKSGSPTRLHARTRCPVEARCAVMWVATMVLPEFLYPRIAMVGGGCTAQALLQALAGSPDGRRYRRSLAFRSPYSHPAYWCFMRLPFYRDPRNPPSPWIEPTPALPRYVAKNFGYA